MEKEKVAVEKFRRRRRWENRIDIYCTGDRQTTPPVLLFCFGTSFLPVFALFPDL